MRKNQRHLFLLAAAFAGIVCVGLLFLPRIQPLSYHQFADRRTLYHLPHALNVASNLPFLVFGVLGIYFLFQSSFRREKQSFEAPEERWAYFVFFVGSILTSFGSAYYHLQPSNFSLFFDRLPMTLVFMGLLSTLITERIHRRGGVVLLFPLVLLGILSVVYWRISASTGHEDLRPYLLVQFGPMVLIPCVLAMYPSRYTHASQIWLVLLLYGAAKGCESFDHRIFLGTQGYLSGHTIKHILAALGIYLVYDMLRKRAYRS